MIIALHVIVALASIVASFAALARKSTLYIKYTYALTALTFVSGTILVVTHDVHLLQVCASGLLFIGFVSAGIAGAYYRLARETVRNK